VCRGDLSILDAAFGARMNVMREVEGRRHDEVQLAREVMPLRCRAAPLLASGTSAESEHHAEDLEASLGFDGALASLTTPPCRGLQRGSAP